MKRSSAFTLLGKTCLLAVFLSACTKEDDPAPERPACKLTKQYWSLSDPDRYLQYEYNAGDQMVKFTDYQGGKDQRTYTCEYDQQGRLIKAQSRSYWTGDSTAPQTHVTGVGVFNYNTKGQVQTVVETYYFDNSSTPGQVITISCDYDAQGNRTRVSSDNSADPYVTLFEYKDGNCIKETRQAGTPQAQVYIYEYYSDQDNKMRTSHLENAYTRHTPNRNLLKRSTFIYQGSPTYNGFIDYSYEFNQEGFPVKITSTVSDNRGTSPILQYEVREYGCQ